MRRKYTLLSLLPSHRQAWPARATGDGEAPANVPGSRNSTDRNSTETGPARARTEQRTRSEAFQAQTFPHMDALYSDALCLTGSLEDAMALVIKAYDRAFQEYDWFRRRSVPDHLRTRSTRAWLYGNLHGAFCDAILGRTAQDATPIGGRP